MKKLFTLLVLLCSTYALLAQDVHLTQYYTSNQLLNPALTGNYNGDYRAVLNYRSQWKQVVDPLTTSAFSLEKKYNHFTHDFGLGFIFINDQLTTYGLQNNKIYLSLSYTKKLGKNALTGGLQGGYINRSTNLNGQTFPGQWDYTTGTFNPNISNNESDLVNNKSFINMNAGILYSRYMRNKTLQAGYALFNVNRPDYSLLKDKVKLPFRHVANASLNFNLSPVLNLRPQVLYMTTVGATDLILSGVGTYKLNAETAALLGFGFRGGTVNGDAALAVAGINYKRIELGFSFDFNISELSKETPRKSVWEISLIYTTPSNNVPKTTINCDRY